MLPFLTYFMFYLSFAVDYHSFNSSSHVSASSIGYLRTSERTGVFLFPPKDVIKFYLICAQTRDDFRM